MNREEFLRGLGASLNGAVPPSVIQENLRYYDEYIRSEVARGRSEEEVIDEIGGYRLIAKSIIEANGGENQDSGGYGSTGGEEYYGGAYRDEYGGNGSGPYSGYEKNERREGGFHMYDLSHGWKRFIIPVVLIVVFILIFTVIGGLFTLLSPLIGPLLVIWFLVVLFRNRR